MFGNNIQQKYRIIQRNDNKEYKIKIKLNIKANTNMKVKNIKQKLRRNE